MKERIKKFIDSKGIKISSFERECGLSNGAVSKMGDNTRQSTIDIISNRFPDLNTAWLRTGEGEMLKKTSNNGENPEKRNSNDIVLSTHSDELPVIPRNVCEAAGLDIMEYITDHDVPTSPKVEQFPIYDAYYVVYGDEMAPYFLPGDKLAVSPYEKGKERKVLDGRTYLVDTIYNGLMLRQLHKIKNGFLAKAINPQYGEEIIEMEDIIRIYRVLGLLRTNC